MVKYFLSVSFVYFFLLTNLYFQCTGEAEYTDDVPPQPGQLYGSFVKSSQGNAKIQHMDTSAAMVRQTLSEPAHEIMVLITKATMEGSGEPAHARSLASAFAVRTYEVWT